MSIEPWEEAIQQEESEEHEWMKTEHVSDKAQEWTVRELSGEVFLCSPSDNPDDIFRVDYPEELALAINAALAAERDKHKVDDRILDNVDLRLDFRFQKLSEEIQQLRQQLEADEPQRSSRSWMRWFKSS